MKNPLLLFLLILSRGAGVPFPVMSTFYIVSKNVLWSMWESNPLAGEHPSTDPSCLFLYRRELLYPILLFSMNLFCYRDRSRTYITGQVPLMGYVHQTITYTPVICCAPARTRTLDPLIKSQLLYQLSYKSMVIFINFHDFING